MNQPELLFVSPQNGSRARVTSHRAEAPPVSRSTAEAAAQLVLAQAGCTVPRRDPVDERVVQDVVRRRARILNDPAEVGGWPVLEPGTAPIDTDHDGMPDAWERQQQLDPSDPADTNADADQDGYTNLEEYLQYLTDALPD